MSKDKLSKYHTNVHAKISGIELTIAHIISIEDVDTDFTDVIIGTTPKHGLVCLLVNQKKDLKKYQMVQQEHAPDVIYIYLKSLRKLKALNIKAIETLYGTD